MGLTKVVRWVKFNEENVNGINDGSLFHHVALSCSAVHPRTINPVLAPVLFLLCLNLHQVCASQLWLLNVPQLLVFFITCIRSHLSACLVKVFFLRLSSCFLSTHLPYVFNVNSLMFQGKKKWQFVNLNVSHQRKVSYYVSTLSLKLTFWQLHDQLDAGSQRWEISILTYVHL